MISRFVSVINNCMFPYIRKKPVWELCSDKEVEIEVGSIVFSGTDTGPYTFSPSFISLSARIAVNYELSRMFGHISC